MVSLPSTFGERTMEYLDRILGYFYLYFVLIIEAEARPVCFGSHHAAFM